MKWYFSAVLCVGLSLLGNISASVFALAVDTATQPGLSPGLSSFPSSLESLEGIDLDKLKALKEATAARTYNKVVFNASAPLTSATSPQSSELLPIGHLEKLAALALHAYSEALEEFNANSEPQSTANETQISAKKDHVAALVDQLSTGILELKAQKSKMSKAAASTSSSSPLSEEKKAVDSSASDGVSSSPGNNSTIASGVLNSVQNSANTLEEISNNDAFEKSKLKGAKMEAVLKVEDGDVEDDSHSTVDKAAVIGLDKAMQMLAPSGGIKSPEIAADMAVPAKKKSTTGPDVLLPSRLIDVDNNEYVLSQSADISKMYEDEKLLRDIMMMLLACFVFAFVSAFFKWPLFLGYIMAGVTLKYFGLIRTGIQMETIARGFGTIFLMFVLGLEFNVAKIRQIFKVSVIGSIILLLLTVFTILGVGWMLKAPVQEMVIIGISVFLSSTAIIVNFLSGSEAETLYGKPMVGLVVCQDVMFGLFLAVLPALDKSGEDLFYYCVSILSSLAIFFGLSLLIGYYMLGFVLQHTYKRNRELFLLGVVAFCFLLVLLSAWLKVPLELACFVAGVVINTTTPFGQLSLHMVESIRDFFLSLFFCSIGLHVYPSFMMEQFPLLLLLALLSTLAKIILAFCVMRFIFRYQIRIALIIAVGLSQISEYVFVFAARAKGANLIGRETFYLILGTTSLSLVMSPMLWYMLGFFRIKPSTPNTPLLGAPLSEPYPAPHAWWAVGGHHIEAGMPLPDAFKIHSSPVTTSPKYPRD